MKTPDLSELDRIYVSMRDVCPATYTAEESVYWMWRMQEAIPSQTLTQVREYLKARMAT